MEENNFNKSLSSSMEHGGCEEPEVCQLTHEASMARLRRLWKVLARRAEKTEFEEVTLCGPNVARFLSEQLGSGCQWVRYAAMDLLCGAVPRLGDPLLLPLVPRVLSCPPHAPRELRLKALHFLRALRKHSTDLHSLCTYYLEHGLESGNEALRIACIHGASVVFDEELEDPQYALLLPALATPLTRPPGPAYLPAFRALRRIHMRIGDARFRAHVTTPHYADLLFFEETDPYLALDPTAQGALPALVDAYQRKRRRVRLSLAFGVADPALLEAVKDASVSAAPRALEAAIRAAAWGEADMESHVPDLLHLASAMMCGEGAKATQEAGLGIVRELTVRLGLGLAPHLERVVRALLGARLAGAEKVLARLMREVHPMTVLLEVLRVGGEEEEAVVRMVAARIRRLPYYYIDIMTLCRCMGQWSSECRGGVQRASKECLDLLMEIIDSSPVPDLKAQVLNTLIRDKILQPRPLWSGGSERERRVQCHTADEERAAVERAARNMYGRSGVKESLPSTQVPDDFELATPSSDVTCERKGQGDTEEWQKSSSTLCWKEKAEEGAGDEEPSPCSSEATLNDQQLHCQVKQMNPKKYNFNILTINTPPETPQSVFELEAGDEASETTVHPSSVQEPDTPPDPHRSQYLKRGVPRKRASNNSSSGRSENSVVSSNRYKKVTPKDSRSSVEDFIEEEEIQEVVSEAKDSTTSIDDQTPTFDMSDFEQVPSTCQTSEEPPVRRRQLEQEEVVHMTNFSDHSCYEYFSESDVSTLDRKQVSSSPKDLTNIRAAAETSLENVDSDMSSGKKTEYAPKKSCAAKIPSASTTQEQSVAKRRTSIDESPAKKDVAKRSFVVKRPSKSVEQDLSPSKKPVVKSIRGGHPVGDSLLESSKVVAPKRPVKKPSLEGSTSKASTKKPVKEKWIQQHQDIVEEDPLETSPNIADVPKKTRPSARTHESLSKFPPLAEGPKERGDFEFDTPAEERGVGGLDGGDPPMGEEEEEIVVPPASYPIDDISEHSPPFRKGRELPRTPVKVSEKSDLIPEKVAKKPVARNKKPQKVSVKKPEPAVKKRVSREPDPPVEVEEDVEIEEQIEEDENRGAGDSAYKGSQWRRDLEYASKGGECAWARRFEGTVLRMRPFESNDVAEAALKKALDDLEGNHWKAKEEAMSTVIRAAKHHPRLVSEQVARLVVAVCGEVKNFRQSVAGKAILTAGHLYALMGKQLESKLRLVVGALLSKSGNRTLAAYFRLVIRSLFQIIRHSSLPKAALAFIKEGSGHANKASRETAAQFLAVMTESLGWKGALSPPMAPHTLRCAHVFAFDCSPLARYCGKRMIRVLMSCPHLDRLREQHLSIDASSSLVKVLEQIESRGVSEELLPIHLIK